MQKHRGDPAAVPSQPTVGDPNEGTDQEIEPEKAPAERSRGGKPAERGRKPTPKRPGR
jgi:hypothetical protein